MDYLNPALVELEARIAATWPTIVRNDGKTRLWRGEHVVVLPLEKLIEAHGLPYAVLVAAEETPVDIDAENTYGLVACEAYFIAENAGKPHALVTQGQLLRDALWPDDPLTLSQVWTKPRVSTSLKLDGNRVLRVKKEGLLSVGVLFQILTGSSA